jgi:signal transduction histidine kinase
MEAQDEERRRIARELHDGTGQALTLLIMNLGHLCAQAEKAQPDINKLACDCTQLAKEISDELRTISYLLHPPLLDDLGLASAMQWYVDGFKQRTGIDVGVVLPPDLQRLSPEVETAIFRIVQESLTNVHRHSGSATAGISLRQMANRIVLEVWDSGRGMPREGLSTELGGAKPSGLGLRGMRERVKGLGGHMEIVSTARGTDIKAVIPTKLGYAGD